MEKAGAMEMFLRPIETRSLKYATFVGDGDTDCFGNVAEACNKKYGDQYVVKKEECVGHVQKRLGTALRKYKVSMRGKKLRDGKTVGGKARLTDKVVDKMQNFWAMVSEIIVDQRENETVCEFNTGAACLEEILNQFDIQSTSNSFAILRSVDSKRLSHAAKKVFMKAGLQRTNLRARRKGVTEKEKRYIAGTFGVQKTSELDLHVGFAIIDRRIESVEPEIRFDDERKIFSVKEDKCKRLKK
eukprot:gene18529-20390_t